MSELRKTGTNPPALDSRVSWVGVGFIDIADYTVLSKFLSPKENQALLNGLYTAFGEVLHRHGGLLNKTEGDCLMFQFDPWQDAELRRESPERQRRAVIRRLFFTCIEIQRICVLFNQADEVFLTRRAETDEDGQTLKEAFSLIRSLRQPGDLSQALEAFFQIRVRIGAHIGEVQAGNFGPRGAQRWDIIGLPVIEARRMEATAPIGGLRISEALYKELRTQGALQEFSERFVKEAQALGSLYRFILPEELFRFQEVTVREKHGATYRSYSVQVVPNLPEMISNQVVQLLQHGDLGRSRILDLLRYYRGNRLVTQALEATFRDLGLALRKHHLMEVINPTRFSLLTQALGRHGQEPAVFFERKVSLFSVFRRLDRYLDKFKAPAAESPGEPSPAAYDEAFQTERKRRELKALLERPLVLRRHYFETVVFPLVFISLEASLKEYQMSLGTEDL